MKKNYESEKKFKVLSANRAAALRDLYINPTRKGKNEVPYFLLYLNYAVNNIVRITGIDANLNNPLKVADAIKSKNKVSDLAHFLWLFNAKNPKEDFPKSDKIALDIATKIYELRNYFAHTTEHGVQELLVNRELYVFIEGQLADLAREKALKPGLRTDKLFKMKLLNVHDKNLGYYEFTRKGLIFLICLAQYRDDAFEFCNLFDDMKLPVVPKCSAGMALDMKCPQGCQQEKGCNVSRAKAYIEMFTAFSIRKGRDMKLLADDVKYMHFADIIGYLNKVPAISHDYLSLDQENAKLKALSDASTESEENKAFKYQLHRRYKDRFLSFAAGYIEDFDLLPVLKFKRLDISAEPGRKRYTFGKETDNSVRMDRHYAIEKDAIRFTYLPKEHYGPIHINALRSAVSASELKRLLLLICKENKAQQVNDGIEKYFAAYHRILEEMLNTEDCSSICLYDQHFEQDFSTVTGATTEQLESEDFLNYLTPYFPENLTRYFLDGEDNRMTSGQMRKALFSKVTAARQHADDFVTRLDKRAEWKKAPRDPEKKTPPPVCTKDEVKNPPRICKFSDAALISWFFRYVNLFLSDKEKFRQLPTAKQHRGEKDFEYQFVHKLVGKFNLAPTDLWGILEKRRPTLANALKAVKENINRQMSAERAELRRNPKYDAHGRPVRVSPTLTMLARACAEEYSKECRNSFNLYVKASDVPEEKLRAECKRFGVRTGMPLDRDALIKVILRLDPEKWSHAYDYEKNQKYENRTLEGESGHIVSQVPFPNTFSVRCAADIFRKKADRLQADGTFDFGAEFRNWQQNVLLRNYYDVKPLLSYTRTHDKHCSTLDEKNAQGIRKDAWNTDFSAASIGKVIGKIKDVRNQDMLLCDIAMKYWENFKQQGTFLCEKVRYTEKPTVYEYFENPVLVNCQDNCKLQLTPNDVNRPVLSQILKDFESIRQYMDPDKKEKIFEFYRMVEALREIKSSDREKRLAIIPLIEQFAASVVIPAANYSDKSKDEKHAMEIKAYQQKYKTLTPEEYEVLVNTRNAVYHDGILLKTEDAGSILKRLLKR